MINKIEHIGIAVKDLKKSEELFQKLLGEGPYKNEEVYSEGVITSFFKVGQQKIELLEASNLDSPIQKVHENVYFPDKGADAPHYEGLIDQWTSDKETITEETIKYAMKYFFC